jgi:hypothetical protein
MTPTGHAAKIPRTGTQSLSHDAPPQSDWSVTVEGDEDDRLPKTSPERTCGLLADSLQVTGDG